MVSLVAQAISISSLSQQSIRCTKRREKTTAICKGCHRETQVSTLHSGDHWMTVVHHDQLCSLYPQMMTQQVYLDRPLFLPMGKDEKRIPKHYLLITQLDSLLQLFVSSNDDTAGLFRQTPIFAYGKGREEDP